MITELFFFGEEKPLHNINRDQDRLTGRCNITKIWNQETDSWMQIQKVYNKLQITGNIQEQESQIQCLKKASHVLESYSLDTWNQDKRKKKRRRKGAAHNPKHTTSCVKHGGGSIIVTPVTGRYRVITCNWACQYLLDQKRSAKFVYWSKSWITVCLKEQKDHRPRNKFELPAYYWKV